MIRAALEKIMWGEARRETTAMVEKSAREIDELIKAAEEAGNRVARKMKRRDRLRYINEERAEQGLAPLPDDYDGPIRSLI